MIILSRALTTYLLVSKLSLFEQGFSQSKDFPLHYSGNKSKFYLSFKSIDESELKCECC